jgi:hypothetical protein
MVVVDVKFHPVVMALVLLPVELPGCCVYIDMRK